MRAVGREHWYFISVYCCPACGRCEEFRERRYGPRPEAWEDRHQYSEVWDGCEL